MTFQPVKLAAETICLLTLAGCAVFVAVRLSTTLDHADSAIQSLQTAADELPNVTDRFSDTLDIINAPCIGIHGSTTCGPLAQLSQTEKNIGIVAGLAAQQVRQTGTMIQATTANIDKAGDSVVKVTTHLSKTADAATELTQEATAALRTVNEGTGPLLKAYTRSGDDLDALLKSHAIYETLDNVQTLTGAAAHITNDAQRVADDATAKYFKPTPWYRRTFPYLTTGAKIASYALPWP